MGCSTCGKRAQTTALGGSPKNPIILGEDNGELAQVVTFQEAYASGPAKASAGQPRYVSGDGVEAAVESGLVVRGAPKRSPKLRRTKSPESSPHNYWVDVGGGEYLGFAVRAAAERYAKVSGRTVYTREQVLKGQTA